MTTDTTTMTSAEQAQQQLPAGLPPHDSDGNPMSLIDGTGQWVDQQVLEPVVFQLGPNHAVVGGPDLIMTVRGQGFTRGSVIVFNGGDEPTTFVSSEVLLTRVRPSTASGPADVQVQVRSAAGNVSDTSATFSFTSPPLTAYVGLLAITAGKYNTATPLWYNGQASSGGSCYVDFADVAFPTGDFDDAWRVANHTWAADATRHPEVTYYDLFIDATHVSTPFAARTTFSGKPLSNHLQYMDGGFVPLALGPHTLRVEFLSGPPPSGPRLGESSAGFTVVAGP